MRFVKALIKAFRRNAGMTELDFNIMVHDARNAVKFLCSTPRRGHLRRSANGRFQ